MDTLEVLYKGTVMITAIFKN